MATYDHSKLKSIAKANPGLRWQFYNTTFGCWQTLPKNKVPAWHVTTNYRVKPGQNVAQPVPDKMSGVNIDKATPKKAETSDLDTKRVFERIANVLSVLRQHKVLTASACHEAMEFMRFDTSFNQRHEILRAIKGEV